MNNIFKLACLSILMMGCALAMDVNRRSEQLLYASTRGNVPEIEYLIAQGANVNARDPEGRTPLHWATVKDLAVCKVLIAKGADINAVNKFGITPLMSAAFFGKDPICRLLIAHRADLSLQDNFGNTALMTAAGRGNKETCKLLVRAMLRPTKPEVQQATAYLESLKRSRPDVPKDIRKEMVQSMLKVFRQQKKPAAEAEINRIQDEQLRNELLRYLRTL